MKKNKHKSLFITFEGGEGSGKSTHIRKLVTVLERKGLNIAVFHEPGSTSTGERIRRILLNCKNKISAECELFLYLAARAQFVREKLIPALNKYDVILCDRFEDSTLVYQGYGLKLGAKNIFPLAKFASQGIKPDLTFVLDLPPKQGLLRINRKKDRIEKRKLDFHSSLRKGYKELSKKEPTRVKIINAKNKKETFERIISFINRYV